MRRLSLFWHFFFLFVFAALAVGWVARNLEEPRWIWIALALVLVAAQSYFATRQFRKIFNQWKESAQKIRQGETPSRLLTNGIEECETFTNAFDEMAQHLDQRLRNVLEKRNEQEAVLGSMVEGVLAVDREERLINLNRAAAELFNIEEGVFHGRPLQELIRNSDLNRFVKLTLSSSIPVEGEIVLFEEEERTLQANGTVLRDSQNHRMGALIVLNDVTRLKKLETMRRDFVANVSHELKTPITSIKGFVETLLDGAMENPEDTKRFLAIMANQADRLNAIIEDLLSLSRIEQQTEQSEIALEPSSIQSICEAAVQLCAAKAKEKDIPLTWNCEPGLKGKVNPALLEQALVNLLDNAIKYSEPGQPVELVCERHGGELLLSVRDHGPGIDKAHLTRVFERFYRIDKGRSRKLGGTGLGLAIVKHIAQAHHGNVQVESELGKGSVFTLHLPAS